MESRRKRAVDRTGACLALGADGATGYTSVEICAGAGGQAYGVEQAGFRHLRLVEYDEWCCKTLQNRKPWKNIVRHLDLHEWSAAPFEGKVDLFAGGVPCPPFSRAGMRLGPDDERDLFPKALEQIGVCKPRALLLENVRNLLSPDFADYRAEIKATLTDLGYEADWRLFNACDFGVPQLRPRAILVGFLKDIWPEFSWPVGDSSSAPTVGQALRKLMAADGWPGAGRWAESADRIAPTLVGGSKKHGGPDLGPTQAKKQWLTLGVDGMGIADQPPPPTWNGHPPRLTVQMAAVLQGFPGDWPFEGKKTNAYRQVGNAFPPPVARAMAEQIWNALASYDARTAVTETPASGLKPALVAA